MLRLAHKRRAHGFSLLEVMVSIAILGLAVTVILSAQGGLAATNKSAANMGSAISLGRCRMTEIEEKLLKLGYPVIDEIDSSTTCCDDREVPGFACEWKVERVILPNPPTSGGADGGFLSLGGDGGLPTMPGAGTNNPLGGAGLDFDAGIAGIGQNLTSQMGVPGGAAGMLSMVFTIVYPSLKPLLETAIRRLTVTITWREGLKPRELTFMQYVSSPAAAGFAAGMDGGVFDGGASPAPGAPGAPGGAGAPGGPGASPLGPSPFGGGGAPPPRPGTLQ
jgi:general secretion pathway protein I